MKRELQKLIDEHGPAQVAIWLGYKDTPPIKAWFLKGRRIPKSKRNEVKALIKSKADKGETV